LRPKKDTKSERSHPKSYPKIAASPHTVPSRFMGMSEFKTGDKVGLRYRDRAILAPAAVLDEVRAQIAALIEIE
jgi:hypothetical protein